MIEASGVQWTAVVSAVASGLSVLTTLFLSVMIYRLSKRDAVTHIAEARREAAQQRLIEVLSVLYRELQRPLGPGAEIGLYDSLIAFQSNIYYLHALPDECAPLMLDVLSAIPDLMAHLRSVDLSDPSQRQNLNKESGAIARKVAKLQTAMFRLAASEMRSILGDREEAEAERG